MSALTRSVIPALVAALAAALPIGASHAATNTPGIRLSYDDLNLATPAGVSSLYRRIQHAAGDYCESTRNLTGTRVSPQYDRCVRDAVATTVKQISHPGLSALHASRGGSTAS